MVVFAFFTITFVVMILYMKSSTLERFRRSGLGVISPSRTYDFLVRSLLDGERVDFYVLKCPFFDEFLQFLSTNNYGILVFTVGIEEYTSLPWTRRVVGPTRRVETGSGTHLTP
uniref:FCP1 homology domain-containing protein n=1 Tax=Lactuca sativa TaxID=4236 RepID=A0A9R1VCQ0_LACSA|nr:hypothetical protein LSAT_V11C600318220 [Lactuca sativa]